MHWTKLLELGSSTWTMHPQKVPEDLTKNERVATEGDEDHPLLKYDAVRTSTTFFGSVKKFPSLQQRELFQRSRARWKLEALMILERVRVLFAGREEVRNKGTCQGGRHTGRRILVLTAQGRC